MKKKCEKKKEKKKEPFKDEMKEPENWMQKKNHEEMKKKRGKSK